MPGSRTSPNTRNWRLSASCASTAITRYRFNPVLPGQHADDHARRVAARTLGIFERYVDEVFRHMWAEPKKLDDPAVLKAALIESGLPADRMFELVQTPAVKEALIAETQRAVDRGTFGSPTFFVDGEIYFGKDRLRDVEEAIAARKVASLFGALEPREVLVHLLSRSRTRSCRAAP
jgi:2-hydroxychromene-2-carboxylate isomerase